MYPACSSKQYTYLGRKGGVMLFFLLTSASFPTREAFLLLSSSLSRRSFFTVRSCSASFFSKPSMVWSLRARKHSSSSIFSCRETLLEDRLRLIQRVAIALDLSSYYANNVEALIKQLTNPRPLIKMIGGVELILFKAHWAVYLRCMHEYQYRWLTTFSFACARY